MGSNGEQTVMRVKEIRIYPIKSIRGISLQSHQATTMGFAYDRIFMLQRVSDDKNMHVPSFTSMCLFTTELSPAENPDKVLVHFALDHTFDRPDNKLVPEEAVLEVPLHPRVEQLKQIEYILHTTVARGYVMPEKICKWFSDRFGFEVRLNYVGSNQRQVLGNMNPSLPRTFVGDPDPKKAAEKQASSNSRWLGGLMAGIGNLVNTVAGYAATDTYEGLEEGLTFADVAAYLVINYTSFLEAQGRVQTEIDVEKFRPNIVVEGAKEAWAEDYWAEIAIGPEDKGIRMALTNNCARCASLNVDYMTGRPADGGQGQLLKSLQKDRRVDPGSKYSPIFGRYAFLSLKNGTRPEKPITIRIGDEVQVTKTNERRTHFYWPNLGT